MDGKTSSRRWLGWQWIAMLCALLGCLPFSLAGNPGSEPSPEKRVSTQPTRPPSARASKTVRFSIAPLTESYVLVQHNPWSGYTRTFRFMYPAGWTLQTTPPGVFGASPSGLDKSGLVILVTPEKQGATHFVFTQSPVISGLVDMQSAVSRYMSQRLSRVTIVSRQALPQIVAGTAQVQTLFLAYRGPSGDGPVEGWLGFTLGTMNIGGAYYSNIVVHEFQVALDLPKEQQYAYLNGLRGISTTLSGSWEQDAEGSARAFSKALGGSAEARDPTTGTTMSVPLDARECWVSGNEVQCFEQATGSPGPGWTRMETAPASGFPGQP